MAKSETMGTPGADPLQVAARVAGQANLLDIRYFRLNAEFGTFPDEGREMDYDLKSDMSCTTQEGGTLVVDGEYRVRIYQFNRHSADQHGESDKTEDIAELSLNLAALYDVGNSDFGSDELAAFTETAGSLALYPYLRSAVSDLTARLGLPSLTLPTMRVDLAASLAAADDRPGSKRRRSRPLIYVEPDSAVARPGQCPVTGDVRQSLAS